MNKIFLLGCSADPVQSGPQLCPGETGNHSAFGHISEVASDMEEIDFLSRSVKILRQSINSGSQTESPLSHCA
jgi:hypothetical protein